MEQFNPSSEMRRKLRGENTRHELRQARLYNGEPGQRFRMSDGAEYQISLKDGFKRIDPPKPTKKERAKARRFLKRFQQGEVNGRTIR